MFKKNNTLLFKSVGKTIFALETSTSIENDIDILLKMAAHIPGFKIVDNEDFSKKADITVRHLRDTFNDFSYDEKQIIYTTNSLEKMPVDIYHLIYGVVRKTLINEFNNYAIHAACISHNNGYKLIVGHSGSGKTTLAQNLVDTHGRKLFSGNKTLLSINANGSITGNGGTRTMTALDVNNNRYAYTLRPDQYADEESVDINAIDIIRINDGVEDCEILSPPSALHTLYPYIIDAVNADIILHDHYVFDGTISSLHKKDLIQKLSVALRQVPVRKVSGSMKFLKKMVL